MLVGEVWISGKQESEKRSTLSLVLFLQSIVCLHITILYAERIMINRSTLAHATIGTIRTDDVGGVWIHRRQRMHLENRSTLAHATIGTIRTDDARGRSVNTPTTTDASTEKMDTSLR